VATERSALPRRGAGITETDLDADPISARKGVSAPFMSVLVHAIEE
jgi:hypothetical protein